MNGVHLHKIKEKWEIEYINKYKPGSHVQMIHVNNCILNWSYTFENLMISFSIIVLTITVYEIK